MDHLLFILTDKVVAYYALKQRRQGFGFEGVDIEVQKRKDIVVRSKTIALSDIEVCAVLLFLR